MPLDLTGLFDKGFISTELMSEITIVFRKHQKSSAAVRRLQVIYAFILLLLPLQLVAQSKSDCLMCHGDKSLTTVKKGKTISLFVNGKNFEQSVHGGLDCVACHEGFKPDQLPHAKKITSVKCQNCHDGDQFEKYQKSVHATAERALFGLPYDARYPEDHRRGPGCAETICPGSLRHVPRGPERQVRGV